MRWLDKETMIRTWSCAAVLLSIWGFYIVRRTVLLLIFALLFAHALSPLVKRLQGLLGARKPALLLAFGTIALLLTGTIVLLHGPAAAQFIQLERQLRSDAFKENVGHWSLLGVPFGEEIIDGDAVIRLQSYLMGIAPQLETGISHAGRNIANLFIVPILGFFLLKDDRKISHSILETCFQLFGKNNLHELRIRLEGILEDASKLIWQYMQLILLLSLAVLLTFSVTLWAMGAPCWLLLALFGFLLEFIPLVGPLVSGITILAVCKLNEYPHMAALFCFLIGYRLFQDYVLSPMLMRKGVNLHPLLVILGVFAGEELGGIIGVFLSVPLMALGRLVLHEYCKSRLVQGTQGPEHGAASWNDKAEAEPVRVVKVLA